MGDGGGSAWIGTMREKTLKLAFRLFPWHVGALNACGAFNFAAAPWKFARKLAARPTGSARHGWKIGVFRPCRFLDSGGLGLRTNAIAHFSALTPLRFVGTTHPHAHLRPTGKATAGSARTRPWILLPLPPLRTNQRSTSKRRCEPRPPRHSAATPNSARTRNALPAVKRRPPARRPRRPNAVAVACRLSLPAGSARTRQGTLGSLDPPSAAAPSDEPTFHLETQAQAATTAAQRRRPELRPHQKRTPAVKRRPPARRPRRPNAVAVACRLSLPGASRDHRGAAPSIRTSSAPETHPSGQAVTTTAQTAPPKRGSSCARPQPAVRTGRTRWR